MILKEIIQRVQSLYSKGVQSSDSRLTARHIYSKIITVRAKLLSQQANKKQKLSDWDYQTISCIELIEVPAHQCPCLPPVGCEMLRSKFKLPKPIMNLNAHLIKSVNSIEGSIRYSEVSLNEKKYKRGSKYTSNKPDYFIQDGYLYLTHLKGSPKVISIVGLFEDPIQAKQFENLCGSNCLDCNECESPLDSNFPIDADMVEVVIELAVKELVEFFNQQGHEDITSNTRDDSAKDK